MSRIINKLSIKQILERVGIVIKSQKNEKIAEALNAQPQTCSNWKTRNAMPWVELFEFSIKHNIQLDWLLTGQENKYSSKNPEEIEQLKEKLNLKEELLRLTKENAHLLRNENTRLYKENSSLKKIIMEGKRKNDSPDLDTVKLRKKTI